MRVAKRLLCQDVHDPVQVHDGDATHTMWDDSDDDSVVDVRRGLPTFQGPAGSPTVNGFAKPDAKDELVRFCIVPHRFNIAPIADVAFVCSR